MIISLLGFIVIFTAVFGGLCIITGQESKGNQIIVNCITVLLLYLFCMQLFSFEATRRGIFTFSIPLLDNVGKYEGIKNLLMNKPEIFALNFVELVVLTLLITWISNCFTFPGAGFAGKITSRIVIVMIGIVVYGFFMSFVKGNILMKWCVYCVECIVTGGSILYTPAMLVSSITGLKNNNRAVAYILKQFPNTKFGRAIMASITASIVFVLFLLVLESQYGSVFNLLNDMGNGMKSWGGVVVIIIGLYFLVNSIKKH